MRLWCGRRCTRRAERFVGKRGRRGDGRPRVTCRSTSGTQRGPSSHYPTLGYVLDSSSPNREWFSEWRTTLARSGSSTRASRPSTRAASTWRGSAGGRSSCAPPATGPRRGPPREGCGCARPVDIRRRRSRAPFSRGPVLRCPSGSGRSGGWSAKKMVPARLAYSACSAWAAATRDGARRGRAAQAATRDGAAWPGPGVGGGRGGRDPRGRARGGRRPPTPGEEAIGRIRMQRVADASADSLLTFVQHAVQPGSVVITDGLQSYRRLPKRGYRHDRRVLLRSWRVGRGGLASRPPGRVAPQALAPGYASGRRQSRASRLLPRRVHLSVQSTNLTPSREALPSAPGTGRGGGSRSLRGDGQGYPWSEEETPPQPVVGT